MLSNTPLRSHHSEGGGPKIDFVRDAYVTLVRVLHDPPKDTPFNLAVGVCATNFFNNAIVALKSGVLPPEVGLEYLALKNPNSGESVFHEVKLLPQLVQVVSECVRDKVASGRAIEYGALHALREYVASPHLVGVDASIAAYRALVVAATRFYKHRRTEEGAQERDPDPIAELCALGTRLLAAAASQPDAIAKVIEGIAHVAVASPLRPGIDEILWRLSRPGFEGIPPRVRELALTAAATRCLGLGAQAENGGGFGFLNRGSLALVLLDTLLLSDEPSTARLATSLLHRVLSEEVSVMRASPRGLEVSSFGADKNFLGHESRIKAIRTKVEAAFSQSDSRDDGLKLLGESITLARAISWGVTANDATLMLSKILPTSAARRVSLALHWLFKSLT